MSRLAAAVLPAALALSLAVLPATALAATVSEGDAVPERTLNDQHGESVEIPGDARVLLKTVEMAPANVANAVLGAMSAEERAASGVLYIADTHAMPPHVLQNVVLPRMQGRDYRTAVTSAPGDAGFMPHRAEHVTVVFLDAEGTVTGIEFADSEPALRELLEAAAD